MAPIVSLAGITKRFGALTANDSIDLDLEAGSLTALLGENGAGKSTLVKILYGLLAPDSGDIRIDGRATVLDSPRAARAAGIGMVFQHFSLFDAFSALENIAVPLEGRRADASLAADVRQTAERYGLAVALDRPVADLSAGERQRIEILRVLMQKPRVIVLDEPTSVLTPAEAEALFATLDRLAADGAAILFISHKLEEVRRLCSHAVILRGGRRVAALDPRQVDARELAAQMVGEGVAAPLRRSGTPGEVLLAIDDVDLPSADPHGTSLEDVTLEVRAGEIVALAGIAGNGQGELFALVSGEAGAPPRGRVRLAGADATPLGINARRQLGAAFVPEDRLGHATLPEATLSENLALSWHATEPIGGAFLDRKAMGESAAGLIERYDIRVPSADPEARRLSGGNLQKYVVGREIARQPRVLVVNQPSWGVDARAARQLRQALRDAADSGGAVLVITQDLDEAFEIADRIGVMRAGRLVAPEPVTTTSREAIGLRMTSKEASA